MKKQFFNVLAMSAMAVAFSTFAQANQEVAAAPKAVEQNALAAEESAFADKLNDQNKSVFAQFNAEQRKKAMLAACGEGNSCGAKAAINPNDAVQAVVKEGVAQLEKSNTTQVK